MYHTLITAQELNQHYSSDDWVILDCRFNLADADKGEALYINGHIKSAQYVNLNQQLSGAVTAVSGRHPLPEVTAITQVFSQAGIGEHQQVVVYDDCSGAMAARTWWLLQWLGHSKVAVLEGGVDAWLQAGYSLTAHSINPVSRHFVRRDSAYQAISITQLCSGQYQLVDARAAARFNGEEEPIDQVAGHIPDAVNRPFSDNLTPAGLFKSRDQLKAQWQTLANDNTLHMCGSGVTACHNILAMRHAGLCASKLYVCSWSEWIRDPTRRVVP
jgi:thiosulfate/3-mercaptopyruvate sulfurtransferase